MKWASALARDPSGEGAVSRALEVIERELDATPDLLLVFISTGLLKEAPIILARLRERFPGATLIGCSGSGVIGAGREAEDVPALSLMAASLPGVRLETQALRQGDRPVFTTRPKAILLFGDPFTFKPEPLLAWLDESTPGVVTAGALASGGSSPGGHRLFLDERVHTSGAVCVALSGDLEVEAVVAQGCRPVGPAMFATAVDGHLVLELDGKSPIDALQKLHAASTPEVQERLRHGLLVGVGLETGHVEQDASAVVVRKLVGLEANRKAIAIGAVLQPLQLIQFMLRDAEAAESSLTSSLAALKSTPAAVLLFSCSSRGRALFGVDDHDAGLVASRFPATPMAGLFSNGELAPLLGRSCLHGASSVLVLLRPAAH